VGRANVGKSTLFNRVLGERRAVVEDRARTTRDRLYGVAEWNDRRFILVDTGGLEQRPGDPIEEKVQEQARLAIGEADVILFVVDAAAGLTPADIEAAELLRRARAPVLVVVNKADNEKRELEGAEFHELGWEELYPISALHGRGTGDLLDALVAALPPESETELERKRREREAEPEDEEAAGSFEPEAAFGAVAGLEPPELDGAKPERAAGPAEGAPATSPDEAAWEAQVASDEARRSQPVRIAIVGRPNVGKSSLLNALLGEERSIVSEVPGTTRDAIDTAIDWSGQPVLLVDTAGIRRRGKVASGEPAERFSALRALKGISRADVAILVLDATDGLTAQDAHVAGYVVEEGKGLVVAINKWDLVAKDERTFDEYARRIRQSAPFLDFAPIIAISARTGQRVSRVLEAALDIAAERLRRVPTGELNRMFSEATFRQAAPPVKGRRPKFYYATQAAVAPPTFVVFTSDASSVHFSYERYLENRLRQAFGFAGTPIRLIFRNRTRVQLERRRQTAPNRSAKAGGGRRSGAGRGGREASGARGKRGS
jgi:GTP-binding protein